MAPMNDQIQITTAWGWNTWKLRQHRLIVVSNIDSASSDTFQEALVSLVLENHIKPITILLHSPGGDVLEGLGMYDAVRAASHQGVAVTIHAVGPVASMAAILLQAADHRVMSPNSRMLLHEIREFSFMSTHTVSDAVDKAKELEVLNDRLAILVADRTDGRLTSATLKQIWRKDRWLWPEEALELGLIDEIALVNLE